MNTRFMNKFRNRYVRTSFIYLYFYHVSHYLLIKYASGNVFISIFIMEHWNSTKNLSNLKETEAEKKNQITFVLDLYE